MYILYSFNKLQISTNRKLISICMGKSEFSITLATNLACVHFSTLLKNVHEINYETTN